MRPVDPERLADQIRLRHRLVALVPESRVLAAGAVVAERQIVPVRRGHALRVDHVAELGQRPGVGLRLPHQPGQPIAEQTPRAARAAALRPLGPLGPVVQVALDPQVRDADLRPGHADRDRLQVALLRLDQIERAALQEPDRLVDRNRLAVDPHPQLVVALREPHPMRRAERDRHRAPLPHVGRVLRDIDRGQRDRVGERAVGNGQRAKIPMHALAQLDRQLALAVSIGDLDIARDRQIGHPERTLLNLLRPQRLLHADAAEGVVAAEVDDERGLRIEHAAGRRDLPVGHARHVVRVRQRSDVAGAVDHEPGPGRLAAIDPPPLRPAGLVQTVGVEGVVVDELHHRPLLAGGRLADDRLAAVAVNEKQIAVADADRLAGQPDQPLDVVLRGVLGILEDEDVEPIGLAQLIRPLVGQDVVAVEGEGIADGVRAAAVGTDRGVDAGIAAEHRVVLEQLVARPDLERMPAAVALALLMAAVQRRGHRAGRNDERLQQERPQQDQQHKREDKPVDRLAGGPAGRMLRRRMRGRLRRLRCRRLRRGLARLAGLGRLVAGRLPGCLHLPPPLAEPRLRQLVREKPEHGADDSGAKAAGLQANPSGARSVSRQARSVSSPRREPGFGSRPPST